MENNRENIDTKVKQISFQLSCRNLERLIVHKSRGIPGACQMRRGGRAWERAIGGEAKTLNKRVCMSGTSARSMKVTTDGTGSNELIRLPATTPAVSCPGMPEAAEQKGFVHVPYGFFAWEEAPCFLCMPLLQQQQGIPEQQHLCGESAVITAAPRVQDWAAISAGCDPARRKMIRNAITFIIDSLTMTIKITYSPCTSKQYTRSRR